ncbi:hypothetical protein PL9214291380 [Planktothrix tepida PCC 9214]|uniref:Uncharacterized protein n=1 Tax=Planktothrix tepida PCC 9214 TaxID=671072 RepID=A0A1J1LH31_9CYAN|nr:hypothetical protein PL9214291380 [Planktothrix tepida PCC 9214]
MFLSLQGGQKQSYGISGETLAEGRWPKLQINSKRSVLIVAKSNNCW